MWHHVTKALPESATDVLCWDGSKFFVGYYEREGGKPRWNGSWTDDFNEANVLFWEPIAPPPPATDVENWEIAAAVQHLKKVVCAMNTWIPVNQSLPEEWADVLVWGKIISNNKGDVFKVAIADYRMDFDDNDKEVPYWSMAGGDGWHMEVTHWMPLPEGPSEVVAAVGMVKELLCNQSPEQIGAEIGGQVTDYDLRVPFDRVPKGGQHPEFLMKDGPRESLDK